MWQFSIFISIAHYLFWSSRIIYLPFFYIYCTFFILGFCCGCEVHCLYVQLIFAINFISLCLPL